MKRFYVKNGLGTYTEVSASEFQKVLGDVETLPDCVEINSHFTSFAPNLFGFAYEYESYSFEDGLTHTEHIGYVTDTDYAGV